jgi:MFS family permease
MHSSGTATDEDTRHALRMGWWIAAIAFLSGIGGGVVFPILPILGVRLGLSAALVGLILAANRITRIFFNPFTGALVDRFGARWPVAAGLFFETVAVLAFSVALHTRSPAVWFVAGRVVWGVGSSLILVGSLAATMMIAVQRTRGRMTGRVRTAMTLGVPAGMLLGGVVADLVSPDAAFLSAAALTLASGVFALFVLPRHGCPTPRAHAQAAGGVWRQMLRTPVLQVVWCSNALVFFAIAGVLLSTLVVLVDARGVHVFGLASAGSAGLLMALLMVFRAVAALGAGAFLDRRGRRTALLLPGAALTALGFAGLAVAGNAVGMALAVAAVGLGGGALNIPLLTLLGDAATPRTHGRAMGLYQVYGDIGGSIGPIVGLQLGALAGYAPIYVGVACAMVVMAVPLYWLVRHERHMATSA